MVIVIPFLGQARRLADYVVFLYLGELIEYGPVETFFDSAKKSKDKSTHKWSVWLH